MKKIILTFHFAFLMTAFSAGLSAQKNIVKMTPLPISGKLGFQYERKISPQHSVALEWQHWEFKRSKKSAFIFFGFFSSSSDVTSVSGNRIQITGRCYAKEKLPSWYMEGGFYLGKFDVKRVQESSDFSVWGVLSGDFGSESKKVTKFENVKANGARIGIGFLKKSGKFFLDFSGGLDFNDVNPKVVTLARSLRFGAPYGRVTVGLGF